MSKTLVIDTSVILKWFASDNEQETHKARQLYQALSNQELELLAPTFALMEISNVLMNKKKVTRIETEQVLTRLATSGIYFVHLDTQSTQRLPALIKKHKLSAYDALFLDLAMTHQCTIITADKKLSEVKSHALYLRDLEI